MIIQAACELNCQKEYKELKSQKKEQVAFCLDEKPSFYYD